VAGETSSRGPLAVAVVVVLAAGVFAYGVRTPAAIPGGPLADEVGVSVGMPADPGRRVSTGLLRVRNPSDVTAEIRRVELVGKDPTLTFVGALVLPRIGTMIGSDRGFPPRSLSARRRASLVEVFGARIPPGQAVDVILGLAALRPGTHGFEQVAVRYRARGLTYRAVYGIRAVVCVPRARGCPDDF
jgi:hypothetical protein